MFLKNTFKSVVLFFLLSCGGESNNEILVINSGKTQGTFYHIKYLIKDKGMSVLGVKNILKSSFNSLDVNDLHSLKTEYHKINIKNKITPSSIASYN